MIEKYYDIPFVERGRSMDGADCWGLVVLYYRDRYGIKLHDHLDCYEKTTDIGIAKRMDRETIATWVAVDKPREGDVVLCRILDRPMHVGLYISPNSMLHIEKGNTPTLEKLGGIKWGKRILAYYRHRSLM